jgi:precorrin-6A/cobalt-precorrin-6A reductase
VRVGGFGGAEQMRQWLVENGIDAVVDATHPFATVITERTADLCADLGLPHVVLARPAWDSRDAIAVASASEAADVIDDFGYSRVFLTSGRSTIGAFKRSRAWYLVRLVIAPDADALPLNYTLLTSRGPYCYDDEVALMRKYRTHVLVTKNSGGDYTRAKLDAAAALYIPIIMIDRPALPAGVASVASVDEAASWLA